MNTRELVHTWFEKWATGDFMELPITEDFSHSSPYGTILGKKQYIDLVAANKDKFLGHRFEIHDGLYDTNCACVRYTAFQNGFALKVSEWYYFRDHLIEKIVSYYNIEGEISEERQLSMPEN